MYEIRSMTQDDVPAVLQIQARCYGAATLEAEAVIRARLDSAPDSAWVAEDGAGTGASPVAYLVAYRSRLGKVTPLGGRFEVAEVADCLYLHDLAVGPGAKGRGVGPALVAHAWADARARGLMHTALVSVQDSRAFWARLGYAVWDRLDAFQRGRLQTYEGPAWYMARSLA